MKKMNKYTLLTIGIMVLFLGVFPATILAMHIPPGGGGPPPPPPKIYPYYYIIQYGTLVDGVIEDCEEMDDDFIQFKGERLPFPYLDRVLGVHLFFEEENYIRANNKVCMKFLFSEGTYKFKLWIWYYDGTVDILGGSYGFTPTHDWQIENYPTDNYKAVSDVYIWASCTLNGTPEISIDYLAVHYGQ